MAFFRRCSTCKSEIPFGSQYYKCSVSTCNRRGTALYFCSVPCWDAHVPEARHRDAWAEVETAPKESDATVEDKPVRRVVATAARAASSSPPTTADNPDNEADPSGLPRDTLVVMSKVKNYVKASSSMRTSDGVSEPLSDHLRAVLRKAEKSARHNERQTVLARDIEAALRGDVASD